MGGFNDKEHRYSGKVPDRAKNVFSGLIRVTLYKPDAILGFEVFLVFEIFKGQVQTGSEFWRPQFIKFFKYFYRIYLQSA